MIEHRHSVEGDAVEIHVVEREEDLDAFRDFIQSNLGCLGLDSETTGLNIYQDDFRCRLVQFGNHRESYVVPVEHGSVFEGAVIDALRQVKRFILHNAAFDLQVFERTLSVPMEDMWPKVTDTKILAHLVDPRARKEGGSGHKLEELLAKYVDAEQAENVKGLMNMLRIRHKTTKAKIWEIIPFEDPDYQLYSGMDPIFAARLMSKLAPLVPAVSEPLIAYEHRISEVCSYMERKGFLLDVEYSEQLSKDMLKKRDHFAAKADVLYGLENVNSTEQCADALERTGVKIKGRTPSGKRQVNEDLLDRLKEEGNDLAEAISEAKKWGKWEKTWVRKFLDSRDSQDRCHAGINPLQARTSRMSITGIPAQTLPASDWMVRRCFLADEGQLMASIDYQTQELRVLAALSGDPTMVRAFLNNSDLHQMTADAAGVVRDVGKMTNFLTVYGGGAGTLSKNAKIPFTVAKQVVTAFERTYPGVAKLSAKLQREAAGSGAIITPKGRRLPVDADRGYSALNYLIQSTSRDVTCGALLRLHDAGFTPYLRLPIHDEVVASVPAEKAHWGANRIGELMVEEMGPVIIGTDPEVGGRSWGSLYVKGDSSGITDPYLLK
jgi:DNA polymerase I-like protein with 3'-5' exonuclease and polymerase domains